MRIRLQARRALWATGTVSSGYHFAMMQRDGNFVLYAGNRAVWATNTQNR